MNGTRFWQEKWYSLGGCIDLLKMTVPHFSELFEHVEKVVLIGGVLWMYVDSIPLIIAVAWGICAFVFLNGWFHAACTVASA